MSITLTEKAAGEVKRFLAEGDFGEGAGIRVAVTGGGCSGFNYSLNISTDFDEAKDNLVEQHGIKVIVDKKSDLYLDGTTVDYHDGLEQRGFSFNNPNAQKTCGCGNSFSV